MKKEYPDFEYLISLAIVAGVKIKNGFGSVGEELKSDGTIVTETDKEINRFVIGSISKDFPRISIIGEEEKHEVAGSEYTVYCDPIDGTMPFCWGLPISTFSISVVKGNNPLVGVIYDPFCDHMWYAVYNKGAFLNKKPIEVSQHNEIKNSKLGIFWWRGSLYNIGMVIDEVMKRGGTWMALASVCYLGGLLASGKIDGIIFPGQEAWETSSMQVLVQEAGGRATDVFGEKICYGPGEKVRGHIMSNGLIHDELVEMVASCQ